MPEVLIDMQDPIQLTRLTFSSVEAGNALVFIDRLQKRDEIRILFYYNRDPSKCRSDSGRLSSSPN